MKNYPEHKELKKIQNTVINLCIFILIIDGVKYKLVQLHDGKVFVKLVTLATLSTNTEVQYNSAGTLGQLALIGKLFIGCLS